MSLEDIREKKHSKWVYVVIGLLLVGMAGFGTSQFGTGSGGNRQALLSAGEAEVSVYEYENTLRYIQQQNPNMPVEMAKQFAVASLKQRVALADYLNRHPLTASNAQIDTAIRDNPNFSDNGQFSEEAFRRVISVSPEVYRESLATEIAMQDFQESIVKTAVVSEADVMPYIDNFVRDIRVASIAREGFSYTPTDADIQTYYDTHKNDYMTAEKIAVEYVDFNPDAIAASEVVTDDEVLAQATKTTQSREANYWIFADKAQADKAFAAYQSGQSVAEVKKAFAEAIQDSGELGKVSASVDKDSLIQQPEADAIFALSAVGELTAPMETENGVMIFELTNQGETTISEVAKAMAKRQLQSEKAKPKIAELGEKLNQAVFEQVAPSLEDIAQSVGMTVKATETQAVADFSGILALPELNQAIAASDKEIGKLQEPVAIGDRVIIYRFSKVEKAQQKPLLAVKDLVSETVVKENIDQQMAKVSAELIKNSQQDGLDKAAQAAGYPVRDYKDFSVATAKDGLLDPMAALLIAEQSPRLGKDNAREIISPTGRRYVYTTTAVRLGESLGEQEQQQIKQALVPQLGRMELDSFMSSVTAKTKITDRSAALIGQ